MTIIGSATLYSIYTSQELFNGQVVLEFSTDGKIFVEGKLNFAANNLSVSGKLYANLSRSAKARRRFCSSPTCPTRCRS